MRAKTKVWRPARPTVPAIDAKQFPPVRGLEGPFRFPSGVVLYYDAKEGCYYDIKTDWYVSQEDMLKHQSAQRTW